MADERLLPASIADDRSLAFLELVDRLVIDLTPLLIYRVDSVPASALYALAWQFGVTGLAGWDLADTETKRRELVRRALEFHRYKGTPWVIKEVLKAVGFPSVVIEEHYGRNRYDGTRLYDGTVTYSVAAVWADFGIVFGEPVDGQPITAARRALLRGIVETWRPARSRFVSATFASYRYDARYNHDGVMNYSGAA